MITKTLKYTQKLSYDVTVLFPTPPLPDNMSNLFFTSERRFLTNSIDGSGTFASPK